MSYGNSITVSASYDEDGGIHEITVSMPYSSTEDDVASMIRVLARNPFGTPTVTDSEPRKLATLKVRATEPGDESPKESKLRNAWGF